MKTLKALLLLSVFFVTYFGSGCKRTVLPPSVLTKSIDSTHDMNHLLASSPFKRFYQAWQRVDASKFVNYNNDYSVFAPTDSAFQAVNLSADSINKMPIGMLSRIILYHVVQGNFQYENLMTSAGNVACRSVLIDTMLNPVTGESLYQQYLHIDAKPNLIINGTHVNQGQVALQASNGPLYPIDRVLSPPSLTLYQFIKSLPELSYFSYALAISDRILGSSDTMTLSSVNFVRNSIFRDMGEVYDENSGTLFAPTNSAFKAAGFTNLDSITNEINKISPVLFNHFLQVGVGGAGSADFSLFYNDFLEIPYLNNGLFNLSYSRQYTLDFVTQNGQVGVKWSNPTGIGFVHGPSLLISDKSNMLTLNGVVHEVDSLFYPQ